MKTTLIAALLIGLIEAAAASAGVTGYYRFPTISKDVIVFNAEGDLWKVPIAGGAAMRLTRHDGEEAYARLSPDGQWLAFSAEYGGNVDVYVMPVSGGEPKRLTYHPMPDEAIAWRPDNRTVVYRSMRASANKDYMLFEVPIEGGDSRPLNIGPAALASFAADGKHIAFNRLSWEKRTWKRYRGGTAPDVWVGDLAEETFRKITDWEGINYFPMWHKDRVYFLSDRAGRMNLFSAKPDGSDLRQHTKHADDDARWASFGGDRIVYMLSGDLWVYDIASGKDRRIDIELPTDRARSQPRFEDAGVTLDRYSLDTDGKKVVLSSRGAVWVSPSKKGRVIEVVYKSGIRVREPVFSPDGTKVAAITDETGEQELAIYDAAGKKPHRVLTKRGQGWIFPPVWSPDGKMLAYADLTMTLFTVDVASGEVTTVYQSPNTEIREYTFSPDSRWLAYTRTEGNWFTTVQVYSLAEKKSYAVTTDFTFSRSPSWDPKGRYLFFLSNRNFNPIMDELDFQHLVTRTTRPYVAVLSKDGKSPFLPDELLDKEKEEESGDKTASKPTTTKAAEPPTVKIDVDGIDRRVVEVPIPPGNYDNLSAVEGRLLYTSRPTPGLLDRKFAENDDTPQNTLHMYDLRKKKTETLVEKLRDYTVSGNGKRMAYRIKSEILVMDVGQKPAAGEKKEKDDEQEKVEPSKLSLRVEPAAEWSQIFADAWRLQRDFYWADNLCNVDWNAMRQKYEKLLPRVGTRNELNDVLGQLIAELGTSHTYIWGMDASQIRPIRVGLLGADLELDATAGVYRFSRILCAENWETDIPSPLTLSHARVQESNYLFAINGQPLAAGESIEARLAYLSGEQVLLTVGTKADRSDVRDIQIETLKSDDERMLRYRDWCRRNREYVDAKSNGRFGYLHIPDMGGWGLVEFIKRFYPQTKKEALVLDLRYNGGGFVSQMMIERFSRELWAYMRPRRGLTETYPQRVHEGPKVVLINQLAGSDGDIFPQSFKLKKLGPTIGMRTWGGVIGIRADKPFVDGGLSTQPEYAWWTPGDNWPLENRGVEPDIVVDYRPEDYIAGRDPQLDRGIAELEKMLQEHPIVAPKPPPFPDKSGKGQK